MSLCFRAKQLQIAGRLIMVGSVGCWLVQADMTGK